MCLNKIKHKTFQFLGKKIGPTYVYLFAHKGSASFTEIFKGGRENYYGNVYLCFIILLQPFFYFNSFYYNFISLMRRELLEH